MEWRRRRRRVKGEEEEEGGHRPENHFSRQGKREREKILPTHGYTYYSWYTVLQSGVCVTLKEATKPRGSSDLCGDPIGVWQPITGWVHREFFLPLRHTCVCACRPIFESER